MIKNKDIVLVTDKINNFNLLLEEIPFPDRMIVEIFSLSDYVRAIKAGVKYPAYCIWNVDNLYTAKKYKFPIVTLAAWSFFDSKGKINLVKGLHDEGVVILTFGTGQKYWNDPEWAKNNVGSVFSKMYSDKWSPRDNPASLTSK